MPSLPSVAVLTDPVPSLVDPVVPALNAGAGLQTSKETSKETNKETALDLVLRRMHSKGDFPALSQAITRIQRIAGSDTESVASLSGEILKDVALTHKLLRMVNTVHYRSAGGDNVNTVSRAVALVGFAGIRNMALSLVLLEGLTDKAQAARLREEFVVSLVASQLASALTPWDADAEEAYLAALFHNLGRLLTEFYLPDEARAIAQLCETPATATATAPAPASARPALSAESAAHQVLGVGLETLGVAVAKAWGLPEELRRALRRPEGTVPSKPLLRGSERNRWLAAFSNQAAQAMQMPDAEAGRRQLKLLADQHAGALAISARAIADAVDQARSTVSKLAPAIGLAVPVGSATHRLLNFSNQGAVLSASGGPAIALPATSSQTAPPGTLATQPAAGAALTADSEAAEVLAAGVQDVMYTLTGDSFALNAVLRMILESLLRALRLRRVVFCLRDPRTQLVTGRFGMGADADRVAGRFAVRTAACSGQALDLFGVVCLKSVDTLIANAQEASIRQRLPAWYSGDIAAPSFLLLPLVTKGATFGLIYADVAQPGGLVLNEREMALVRTLRNQAVMAFKQSG